MRARQKRRERTRRLTILVTIAVIAVSLIVAFYIVLNNSTPYQSYVGKPVSSSVMGALTGVSNATLTAVGKPAGVNSPAQISGSALTSGGKPEVLYIGGDYCPYCAIERWSLIIALSRFGDFSGLTYMLSSSSDVNPNTPTFSFRSATYTSTWITFVGVEEFGQDPSTVVQALTTEQQSLVTQYDNCATSASGGGGIPFVDLGNKYAVNCGAQAPVDMSGQSWTHVANQLDNTSSTVGNMIDGAANTLITAICSIDGHQPASVCSQSYATVTLSYAPPSSSVVLMAAPVQRPSYGVPA